MATTGKKALLLPLATVVAGGAMAQVSMDTVRREYPRLLAVDSDIARVWALVQKDRAARAVNERLAADADVALHGARAILAKGGQTMPMRLASSAKVRQTRIAVELTNGQP